MRSPPAFQNNKKGNSIQGSFKKIKSPFYSPFTRGTIKKKHTKVFPLQGDRLKENLQIMPPLKRGGDRFSGGGI